MNKYLSIITLNVNGLNAPMKRHGVAEWLRKHAPHICCLQQSHLRTKDQHRLKMNGWKIIFLANRYGKKAGVAILISEKNRFQKKKAIKRHKGYYIIFKGLIPQDITPVYIYAHNIGAPKYIRNIL